jgi:membrane-bound lytic murein transglycosylase D
MGDAIALWSPVEGAGRHRRAVPDARHGESPEQGAPGWLPPTEYGVMRGYLHRLTRERRDLAARALARAEVHMPVVADEVRHRGLPAELACIPLVESAFEAQAVSPAGAVGLWQLMPETARRFGLVVTNGVDERLDVRKSTAAALDYLAYLFGLFDDWPLAIAAYNSGEGTLRGAMAKAKCTTLDCLTAHCRLTGPCADLLREETLRFVPQVAAAVLVMSGADEFGLAPAPVLELGPVSFGGQGGTGKQPGPSARRGMPGRTTLMSSTGGQNR